MRLRPAVALILTVLALTGCGSDGKTPSTPGLPSRPRVPVGAPVQVDNGISKGTVVVANPRQIDAPEDWGDPVIVVVDVTITATAGDMMFSERSFRLVTADGRQIGAPTVASDDGLPGAALGTGTVTAPDKVTGVVVFAFDGATAGCRVELDGAGIWML